MQILSNLSLYGTLGLNSVADANTDTDKFLVIDSNGIVKYRTGQELYNDIGAGGVAAYTSKLQHEVKAGVALTKGQAVYVTSADGTNMIVGKASNASEPTSSKTLGLLVQDLAINDIGFVVTEGLIAGLDTSTALAGDPVWLGTDGNLLFGLSNKPHAPAHMVFIGIVTRVQQNNGEIFVKVQNGFELDELHNVQITSTPSDNAVLAYETSTSLYKMKSISTLLGYTPTTNARTLTINGTSYDLSADRSWSVGTHTGNLTTGYVPKATGATTLTDSLIYDNGSAIGINTNSPYESSAFKLDVNGGVIIKNTSGTAAQLILINSNPATGGNNGFVQLSAGGNTDTAFGQWQTYYGMSVASGALRLQPAGGQVLIGTTTTSAFTTDINGTLRVSGQLTLGSTISNNTYVYTMPGASGTLALVSQIPSLSGYVQTSRTLTINGVSYDLSADRSWTIAAGVSSVQAGSGISVSTSGGIVTVSNTITNTNQLTNGAGYITGINSSMVISALGYTPYNSSNPSGYITASSLSAYAPNNASFSDANALTTGGFFTAYNASNVPSGLSSLDMGILNIPLWGGNSGGERYTMQLFANLDTNTNFYIRKFKYFGSVSQSTWYTLWHSGNLTNLNQLTNGPGYITGYTETDTLASVTARGASTSTAVTFSTSATIGRALIDFDGTDTWFRMQSGNRMRITTTGGTDFIIPNTGNMTYNGNTVLHSGNYSSYITQLVSPNGATVVAADSAMPSSGHSFIHTLALGPSGNDGHILGMTWASTTTVYGAQIWVDTDPNNRMAFRSRSGGGVWTSWNEVIHSSNYNSYSPTLTGGGASGTWGISISGNADTVDGYHASGLWKLNEWNGNLYAHTDGRIYGTIFYDANDSTYYLNPNGNSYLYSIRVLNDVTTEGGQGRFGGWYTGTGYTGSAVEVGFSGGNGNVISYSRSAGEYQPLYIAGSNLYLQQQGGLVYINSQLVRQAAGQGWLSGNYASSETTATTGAIYSIGGSYYPTSTSLNTMYGIGYTYGNVAGLGAGTAWGLYVASAGVSRIFLDADNGIGTATGSFRAPIFYDSQNTGYYGDFDSTSNFNALRTASYEGNANVGGTGNAAWFPSGLYSGSTQWLYGTMYRNGSSTYFSGGWEYQLGGIEFNGGPSFQVNNSRNLQLNSGGAADVGVYGRGNGGQFAFQLYGDGGGSYGFLNGVWASWDLRKATNGRLYMNDNNGYYLQTNSDSYVYRIESATDMRAPIFYDSNDTTYYLDPNAGTSLNIAGKITTAVSNGTIISHASMTDAFGYNNSYGTYIGSVVGGTYYIYANGSFYDNGTIRSFIHSGNIGSQSVSYASSAGSADNIDGWSFVNTGSNSGTNANTIASNGISYATSNVSLFGQSDGALYSQAYNSDWQHQIYGDYRTGQLAVRGKQSGSWTGWRTIIDSSTIGSQSVAYASNSGALNGWGYTSYAYRSSGSGYYQIDTWLQMNGSHGMYWPSYYGLHVYANTDGSYGALQIGGSKNGWSGIYFNVSGNTLMMNSTEAGFHQQGVGWQFRWYNGQLYTHRGSTGGGTSYVVMDEGNIASYTAGNVNSISSATGGSYSWTATNYFVSNRNTNTDSPPLQAYSNNGGGAIMSFHRGGYYAVNFGLDSDNVMRIGGWSAGTNRWQLDMSGNMTVAGDVTAYSDARVKENVNTIENALEKVLALRGVSYTRTDSEDKKTKIGVIAQETLPIVPEVVNQDNDGMYNVSYGNFGGLFIEAFKEQQQQIRAQAEQISELKSIIDGLTK